MSKPGMDRRRKLAVAGMSSGDPLDIVNEFYSFSPDESPGDSVHGEYWQTKICVLAERIAKADRDIKALQQEQFKQRGEPCRHKWKEDSEEELAVCEQCGERDSLDIIGLEQI